MRAIIPLAMTVALIACAETTKPAPPAAKTAQPIKQAVASTQPETPKPTPKPTAKPKKVYPPASHLSGLDRNQVTGLLGAPGFKRLDDPALIWQYRTAACALDLFLYRTGNNDAFTVRYFEARSRGNTVISEKDCFVTLLIAHEQRS